MPTFSIIIPTLDEADGIGRTLASVQAQSRTDWDVIVADCGSTDETLNVVRQVMPSATVIQAPRGRAAQMNAGAAVASGTTLVFLHADTRLPPDALDAIDDAFRSGAAAGCFETRFDDATGWMRLWQARMWMRWRRFAFGDRALFVRRETFHAVGGFPDQPLFEDLDFVKAILPERFVFLDLAVITSGRRYRRYGAFRQQLRNAALWTGWMAGIAPERLARFYPHAAERRE